MSTEAQRPPTSDGASPPQPRVPGEPPRGIPAARPSDAADRAEHPPAGGESAATSFPPAAWGPSAAPVPHPRSDSPVPPAGSAADHDTRLLRRDAGEIRPARMEAVPPWGTGTGPSTADTRSPRRESGGTGPRATTGTALPSAPERRALPGGPGTRPALPRPASDTPPPPRRTAAPADSDTRSLRRPSPSGTDSDTRVLRREPGEYRTPDSGTGAPTGYGTPGEVPGSGAAVPGGESGARPPRRGPRERGGPGSETPPAAPGDGPPGTGTRSPGRVPGRNTTPGDAPRPADTDTDTRLLRREPGGSAGPRPASAPGRPDGGSAVPPRGSVPAPRAGRPARTTAATGSPAAPPRPRTAPDTSAARRTPPARPGGPPRRPEPFPAGTAPRQAPPIPGTPPPGPPGSGLPGPRPPGVAGAPPQRPGAPLVPPPPAHFRPPGAGEAAAPWPAAHPGPYWSGQTGPAHPYPVSHRRSGRTAGAITALVLGLGLIGGAVAGALLSDGSPGGTSPQSAYADARGLWHSVPVDKLFPRTLDGRGAGPGKADRTWTRITVAPDSGCAGALDPLLAKTLRPVGCDRLLRATYTDATASSVITVGMIFTKGDVITMKALEHRFGKEKLAERTDLMPRALPAEGTAAEGFGDPQRAGWTVRVLTDLPVVVFSVSGFADGRTVAHPQPVGASPAGKETSAPAQSGLVHEAKGLADGIEKALRARLNTDAEAAG